MPPASSTDVLDPLAPEFVRDPHPLFDALRATGPVVRDRIGWSTIDYATSEAAFHDVALVPGIDHLLVDRGIEPLWAAPDHSLTDAEGEAHRRLRRAVSPWFSVRRIGMLRDRTRDLVDDLLAGAPDAADPGELDVMAGLADVVPARLFCWMVGASDEDADELIRMSKVLLSVFTATDEMVEPVRVVKEEVAAFADELLAVRRARPADDLATALLEAERSGGIERGDAAHLLEELLSASVDNTANTTALALLTLAEHPDAWAAVHDDPALLGAAVEECGRYQPAIRHTIKAAVAPTTVGDVAVEPGEFVTIRIAAAHRDPAVYDDPHTFDLHRASPASQLAFGAGRHYCLGAALGRMEVTEMVGALVARWPAAEVRDGVDMDLNVSGIVRSLPLGPVS
ncbi:cytochrome P450 [Dermatobacter hominis]|uniref:cytochrome P450 n=1 Tax=Dermatobacter hominis TaxID=2884263 RepID=UPI001D11C85A|nr:cytochrome P450 [Dermatobacter hominis]UDY34224.1 cytochrome P450 [Dermatobacter hominis]